MLYNAPFHQFSLLCFKTTAFTERTRETHSVNCPSSKTSKARILKVHNVINMSRKFNLYSLNNFSFDESMRNRNKRSLFVINFVMFTFIGSFCRRFHYLFCDFCNGNFRDLLLVCILRQSVLLKKNLKLEILTTGSFFTGMERWIRTLWLLELGSG